MVQRLEGHWRLVAITVIVVLVIISGILASSYLRPATTTVINTRTTTITATTTATTTEIVNRTSVSTLLINASQAAPVYKSPLECSGQAGQFLGGGIYADLGFPLVAYYDYAGLSSNFTSPAYAYSVSMPGGGSYAMGVLQYPTISACRAVTLAASALGLSPSNYTLGEISMDPVNVRNATDAQPHWTVLFARTDQGYMEFGDLYQGTYSTVVPRSDLIGFSAEATVNAVTGDVTGMMIEPQISGVEGHNYTLGIGEAEALAILRQTSIGKVPMVAADGYIQTIDLAIGNDSATGQLGLLWYFQVVAPNYAGLYAIDAQTGRVTTADVESTLPCGGAPSCGTTTSWFEGFYATVDYNETSGGLRSSPESFSVNGSVISETGTYSVQIPDVLVVSPNSTGSVEVNFTGIGEPCDQVVYEPQSSSGSYCGPLLQLQPTVNSAPPGVSISFSNATVSGYVDQTVTDVMSINVAPSVAQGSYVLEFDFGPSPTYFILTVWNGEGAWPTLPVLEGYQSQWVISPSS